MHYDIVAAILNAGRGFHTQFWKGTTQEPSQPNLVKFGLVVSKEKVYDGQQTPSDVTCDANENDWNDACFSYFQTIW